MRALRVFADSASSKTLGEWAAIVDVGPQDIVELAREFTSHGKKAAADIHRGVSQHTNGYSNVIAWNSLNALVGNYDWKGGMSKATTYSVTADKDGEPIEGMPYFITGLHPSKIKPFGISSIRHDASYEKSTLFADYPAKRPWYPLASDVYQEIIPSIADAYPYPMKALFLYMGTPIYSLPGGHTNRIRISRSLNGPRFRRIASGTPILPMSCSKKPYRRFGSAASSGSIARVSASAKSVTRRACCETSGGARTRTGVPSVFPVARGLFSW